MKNYQAEANELKDRIIVVTGAGNGIGKEIAIALGKYGATVILIGKTLKKLEATYDDIEEAGGPQPAIYPINLEGATDADIDTLASTLEKEFGHIDGLLHNAAKLGVLSRIDDYDLDTWYQVMQVNVNAPFMLTRALLPLLRQSQDASVVFTSDTVGRKGKAYWGAYGVSKFAIEGLMQILAEETRDSSPIRVNSINPGPTRSGIRASSYPGEVHEDNKPPSDLIPMYLWLLGAASKGHTGEAFSFDN